MSQWDLSFCNDNIDVVCRQRLSYLSLWNHLDSRPRTRKSCGNLVLYRHPQWKTTQSPNCLWSFQWLNSDAAIYNLSPPLNFFWTSTKLITDTCTHLDPRILIDLFCWILGMQGRFDASAIDYFKVVRLRILTRLTLPFFGIMKSGSSICGRPICARVPAG